MPNSHPLLLLGLPWVMGLIALLVGRNGSLGRGMLTVAAGLFGLATGLRAVLSQLPVPGPGAAHFVVTATLATFIFYRAWSWIEKTVT